MTRGGSDRGAQDATNAMFVVMILGIFVLVIAHSIQTLWRNRLLMNRQRLIHKSLSKFSIVSYCILLAFYVSYACLTLHQNILNLQLY